MQPTPEPGVAPIPAPTPEDFERVLADDYHEATFEPPPGEPMGYYHAARDMWPAALRLSAHYRARAEEAEGRVRELEEDLAEQQERYEALVKGLSEGRCV